MSLKTKVKVGNITNLSDARYCAGMGAAWLGFPMKDAEGLLFSPEKFTDITGWVSGPEFVLEAEETNLKELYKIIDNYPAHYLQLDASQIEDFDPTHIERLIVSIDIHEWQKWKNIISESKALITHLLITNSSEGNPKDLHSLIGEMAEYGTLILGFGIIKETLTEILELPIVGIALNGSHEERPGMKDYDQLADILEALDTD